VAQRSHLALYSNRELETSNQPRLADPPDRLTGVGNGVHDAMRFRRGHQRRGAPCIWEALRRRAGSCSVVGSTGARHRWPWLQWPWCCDARGGDDNGDPGR